MADDFSSVFAALKTMLARHAGRLSVKTDTPADYTLDTRSPSPFPQHKGQPLFFAAVLVGRAYVSVHLLPLYMCPKLAQSMSPASHTMPAACWCSGPGERSRYRRCSQPP